jgi:hypothetical protein
VTEPDDPNGSRRSTRSLLGAVRDNVQHLIAHELAQAKRELVDGVKKQLSGVVLGLAAAFTGILAVVFAATAAAFALTAVMPHFAAWLTVAAGLFVLTVLLATIAKKRLATPPNAAQTLAETKATFTQLSQSMTRDETTI